MINTRKIASEIGMNTNEVNGPTATETVLTEVHSVTTATITNIVMEVVLDLITVKIINRRKIPKNMDQLAFLEMLKV